jgi:hypothetical protein
MRKSMDSPIRCAHGPRFAFICHYEHHKHNLPGLQRDPDEWTTGDEPMTAAQRS